MAFYNGKAQLIQSTYRAYYCRKYTFDFYALKRWIRTVNEKNNELTEEIREEQKIRGEEILKQVCINNLMLYFYTIALKYFGHRENHDHYVIWKLSPC